jgi:hypothetical protein
VDSNKDNNLITGTKLFKQYEANVHYWNYLVNSLSLILTAKESNAGLLISAGYRCMDCGPYSGITLSVTVNPVSEQTGLIMAFKGRSMSSNRSTLTGTFSSGTTSFTMAADNDMVLRDYLVANVNFHMSTLTAPPPSGTNIYDVTCVWTNTAFGASVSRTKRVTSSYVSPP